MGTSSDLRLPGAKSVFGSRAVSAHSEKRPRVKLPFNCRARGSLGHGSIFRSKRVERTKSDQHVAPKTLMERVFLASPESFPIRTREPTRLGGR